MITIGCWSAQKWAMSSRIFPDQRVVIPITGGFWRPAAMMTISGMGGSVSGARASRYSAT